MSANSPSEVLEKLSEWSDSDVKANINSVLPTLLSTLTSDDLGQKFQVVQALLHVCLPTIPIANVEEKLLQHALPVAKQLFLDAIECIHSNLQEVSNTQEENPLDNIGDLLEVCVAILKCSASVLKYVADQGYVPVSQIFSVPENVALILLEAFKHCKESTKLYGDQLSTVSEFLANFFKESQQVQVQFFNVFVDNVQFMSFVEEELQLLMKVMEVISDGGEILFCLELKSMAEQWKGYTRLTHKYMPSIGPHLNLCKPLSVLISEVERLIWEVMNAPTDPVQTRKCLKVASFLLKIILKLVEQFRGGYLTEPAPCLFDLLLTLYRLSSSVLSLEGLPPTLKNDIQSYVAVAGDPLLGVLFKEASFRKEFFSFVNKLSELDTQSDEIDPIPILLVTALIKLILHCDTAERSLWTCENPTLNIFSAVHSIIKFGHEDLSSDRSIEMVGKDLTSRRVDLYGSLVGCMGALILSAPASEIESIEGTLLDNILEPFFWPALLASDLWVILARSAPSKMCLDQIVFLLEILQSMIDAKMKCPEKKFLCSLLRRLAPLLSNHDKGLLAERYPPKCNWEFWSEIGLKNISEKDRKISSSDVVMAVQQSLEDFKNKRQIVDMTKALKMASAVLEIDKESIPASCFTSIWEVIPCDERSLSPWLSTSETQDSVSCWLEEMICHLCEATSFVVTNFSNQQIEQVLNRLIVVVRSSSSVVKESILKILASLAVKVFDTDRDLNSVCRGISNLFADLLQDKNPMVSYCALETFSDFAHLTKHEKIFTDTVSVNPKLKKMVTNYFQKSFPFKSLPDEHQKFVHDCVTKEFESVISASPPCKKFKFDEENIMLDFNEFLEKDDVSLREDFSILVEKLTQSCANIVEYASVNIVPDDSISRLEAVVSDLQNVITRKK